MSKKILSKKLLSFRNLLKVVNKIIDQIPDPRFQGKIKYSMKDTFLSILAMMFFQNKSMLEFQRNLETKFGKNNLMTLFGVKKTPSHRQIKTIADKIPYKFFQKIFLVFLQRMQKAGYLDKYKFLYDHFLVPLDASQFFSSEKISCEHCLNKQKSNSKHYSHQILQAAIVKPGVKEIIPMFPEAIQNSDGQAKQDCELNAGKRYLAKIRENHPDLKMIINGDGLYSKQPFIEKVKSHKMSYILVVKRPDHPTLYENIANLEEQGYLKEIEIIDEKNRVHTYRFCNNVKLNKNKNTVKVNFFSYELFNPESDKVTYKNSWVTDFIVSPDNVERLVAGGRARWSIENEGFNTLKNNGYHIEHNFGHGKEFLSTNFFVFNLLAFYMHQIFRISDEAYNEARARVSALTEFWNRLRSLVNFMIFSSWDMLIDFVRDPESYKLVRSC